MIDILLRFDSQGQAAQIGQQLGFSTLQSYVVDDESDPDFGQTVTRWHTTPATETLAVCVIGQHQGSSWWVMVRSLVDLELPPEIMPFVVERNPEDPTQPQQRWA